MSISIKSSLVYQVIAQSIKLGIIALVTGLTARYLGPKFIGQLSYVDSILAFLIPFFSLGLDGSLKILLCQSGDDSALVSTATAIRFLGNTIASSILLIIVSSSGDVTLSVLSLGAALSCMLSTFDLLTIYAYHRQRGIYLSALSLIDSCSFAIANSIFLIVKAQQLLFVLPSVIKQLSKAAFLLLTDYKILCLGNIKLFEAKRLILLGIPFIVSSLGAIVYTKSDQLMIQGYLGFEALGEYSVSVRLIESLYFIPSIISQTYFPAIASPSSQSKASIASLYRTAWTCGIAITLGAIFLMPFILRILYGPDYYSSTASLMLLAPSAFSVATGLSTGAWLSANGYLGIIKWRTIAGSALNILLNFLWIPAIGINGAALATTISSLAATFFLMLVYSPETRRNAFQQIFPFRTES